MAVTMLPALKSLRPAGSFEFATWISCQVAGVPSGRSR